MGKIGFAQYFDNDEKENSKKTDDGKQSAAESAAAKIEEGLFFKRLIADNFAAHGERQRLILRSSREIAYMLRNTYPVTELEVTKYMTALGFETATFDGEPLWRLYELHDYEV